MYIPIPSRKTISVCTLYAEDKQLQCAYNAHALTAYNQLQPEYNKYIYRLFSTYCKQIVFYAACSQLYAFHVPKMHVNISFDNLPDVIICDNIATHCGICTIT